MSYIYNLTDTWGAAGTTFAGIKMAVTNTASSASSKLLDLSVSGATTASFAVDKSGNLSLNGSVNKITITAPANGATLTIADGKTFTASNTLTFTGTDSSNVAFGTGGTVAYTADNLGVFAATTSAQLAGVISDETGSGALVFGTSPTFTTSALFPDGTVSAPSIGHSGDTNTGIYFPSADTIGLSTAGVARMTVTDSGPVYIGTTSNVFTGAYLQVVSAGNPPLALRNGSATGGLYWYQGPNNSNTYVLLNQGNAGVYITDGATSWTGTSDERLKNIVGEISNATAKITTLRAVNFTWKSDVKNIPRVGLIAQDVEKVLPEVVSENNGYLGVSYAEMVPLLVAAIKELSAEIAVLKAATNP